MVDKTKELIEKGVSEERLLTDNEALQLNLIFISYMLYLSMKFKFYLDSYIYIYIQILNLLYILNRIFYILGQAYLFHHPSP